MKSSFKRRASFPTRQFESVAVLYSAPSIYISLKVKLQQDPGIKGCEEAALRVITGGIRRAHISVAVTQQG